MGSTANGIVAGNAPDFPHRISKFEEPAMSQTVIDTQTAIRALNQNTVRTLDQALERTCPPGGKLYEQDYGTQNDGGRLGAASGKNALFANFTEEELEVIAAHGVTREYPKGAVVINEGDDGLYIIRSGRVKIYASDESGNEVILHVEGAGAYFGELALIDTAPRSASVVTTEASTLTMVSRSNFERCLEESPEFAVKLICPLVRRIRKLTEKVKNLALLDVYGRVAYTLLDQAVPLNGEQVIADHLTHQEIASMVGASREMVSRIMKDLERGNYIAKRKDQIVINRPLPRAW
jgi:CRP/FNR family cyclic AMP-dependent transcriptional regulator